MNSTVRNYRPQLRLESRIALSHPHPALHAQHGVGLLEVLIALVILAFGSLAISNMQTDSLVGLKVSSTHLKVNTISNQIAEHLKADADDANTGLYNTDFSDSTANPNSPSDIAALVNAWKADAAQLPSGVLSLQCAADICSLSLRWRESIETGIDTQTYNVRIPI